MKNLIISVFLVFLFSQQVYANGYGNGKVEIQHVGGYGVGTLVFFYTTSHANMPACNTYRERWVLDLNSKVGKEQYSLLLAAQMAGRDVQIEGAGTCSLWGDTETVYWVGFPVTHP